MNKIAKEKEFEFKLSEPLLYQHPGGESKTDVLLLKAFSRNHMHRHEDNLIDMRKMLSDAYILYLEKMTRIQSALMINDDLKKVAAEYVQSKKEKEGEDEKEDNYFQINTLFGCLEDFKLYRTMAWELILDGLILADRKIPLTKDLKNDINLDDQDEILAKYTINFILPSWMKDQIS